MFSKDRLQVLEKHNISQQLLPSILVLLVQRITAGKKVNLSLIKKLRRVS